MYDENEHHAQRSTPSRIQSNNLVREWRTFMMKISTTHSVLHRHGYKVAIWCRSGDENEHHAQRSTPSLIQSSNLVQEWRTFMMTINTAHSVLHRHKYKIAIWCRNAAHLWWKWAPCTITIWCKSGAHLWWKWAPRTHRSTVLPRDGSQDQHLTLSTPPEPLKLKLVWGNIHY
jgi:hypothetical protein